VSGGGHSAAFTYGYDGFLAKQVVDGVETRFVRGTGFLCLQERDSLSSVTRSYAWDSVSAGGIGGLLELTQGGAHYDYLYDGKGNVCALLDASQNVVASYSYDEFGVQTGNYTLDQPYRFSTKRYYDGIGLSYYGYRFYAASLGRWLTRDPLGEKGGLNLYGFVGNGPMNQVDYYGLDPARWGPAFDPGSTGGSTYDDAYNEWNNNRQGDYRIWGPAGLAYDMGKNLDKTKIEPPFPYVWLGDPDSYDKNYACQNYADNLSKYFNKKIPPGAFGNNSSWSQTVDKGHSVTRVRYGDATWDYDPWWEWPPSW
jgi:RHS repeat-associated protein